MQMLLNTNANVALLFSNSDLLYTIYAFLYINVSLIYTLFGKLYILLVNKENSINKNSQRSWIISRAINILISILLLRKQFHHGLVILVFVDLRYCVLRIAL